MKNYTARTWKRILALVAALAAMLTLLALPASAKSANGFQYYVEGPFEDDGQAFATITGHKSSVNGTLTIPAMIGGYEVWSIGPGAFAGRKDIKKVVLSDGVGHVGSHAFEDCANLRTLVIGGASIGDSAFAGCSKLKTVQITAYKDQINPAWAWMEDGNDALFNADWTWTHYKKDDADVTSYKESVTGRTLKLTSDYTLKKGESYRWYGVNIDPSGELNWEDCTESSVTCKIYYTDDMKVVCEVINSKGDVVWSQDFIITARRSLADAVEYAVNNTYLYGVTSYTVRHFRWKLMDALEKIGIDLYCA